MPDWFDKQTIGDLLNQAAERFGPREALMYEGRRWSFAAFRDEVDRVARALINLGVQPGDKVSLWMPNRAEWLFLFGAIAKIGAVLVPINTRFRTTDMEYLVQHSDSTALILMDRSGPVDYLDMLREVAPEVDTGDAANLRPAAFPALRNVIVLGESRPPGVIGWDAMLAGANESPAAELNQREVGVSPDDTFLLMYTSGTTGPSKGVLMPHGHLYLFGLGMKVHLGLTPEDRYYICMPLFHAQGLLMQTYGTLVAGGSAVLMKHFRASTWIDDIRKYEATVTNSLGVMNDFILRQPPKPTDTDNKLRIMSALPVTEDTLAALRERFGIPKFNELFGMTEVNIPVWRPLDAPDEAGCSGKVWDDYFEVIIADPDTDEEVPRDRVGEILVRPKEPFCFMQGYNGMPERTVETWRNFWFHTGDAGRMDARGFVWYIDRIKDTIRRRGENISSYEVEAVLLEYPGMEEVAAVAVKAEEGGEDEVLACLVLKPGVTAPKPEAILDFCVPRMPYFAVPRYIEYLDEIPKTPTQKIQKNQLRERGLSATTWDREAAGYQVRR